MEINEDTTIATSTTFASQQVNEALASGAATMIGGGAGSSLGTNATTCTSSQFYMRNTLAATDGLPFNFGFTGKGNDAGGVPLEEIVRAGACGLKLHEDLIPLSNPSYRITVTA